MNNQLKFGDYVSIEQKRIGCINEMYQHKVIGTSKSNTWVTVPVELPRMNAIRNSIENVVQCICCGVVETEVFNYKIMDVEEVKNE